MFSLADGEPVVDDQFQKPEFMGVMMVELRAITEDNFLDAFHLKLAPGQESFVSHPIRSLAQAYENSVSRLESMQGERWSDMSW